MEWVKSQIPPERRKELLRRMNNYKPKKRKWKRGIILDPEYRDDGPTPEEQKKIDENEPWGGKVNSEHIRRVKELEEFDLGR